MWNHHVLQLSQSVLLFSLIIARLLPAAAGGAQRSAECYRLRLLARSRLLASDSTAARRSRASQQQQQRLSCAAAVRPSFVYCGLGRAGRRWQAPAWATTSIPTVANSPLPWRLPRRHEDFPGFNRPLQPLWPLRLNPRYQLVLVMTIGLMMCLKP